jgi:tRNA G18 (ribose-2'-O)-methylase SpoU
MCEVTYAIRQYGSTRSMNASAAGAIAMYAWAMQHLNK